MTFKKIKSKDLSDIQSNGTLYEHEETGARVLYLKNNDPNKAFTIGFKTPPYSDNGITHILEHSVLNGSKKYPSKEPFVELIKGSLNTFVNAMTFSDKTIYPVASTNQKDFRHLMGVYLDAVFQPLFKNNPQILAQEGWHYHLETPEEPLTYKGVVYNEMKGAFGSPERQVYQQLSALLYDNSIYRYESGGDPIAIPELTQAEFIDYHEKYYHPSNSFTILYGDLDLEAAFSDLEEYFAGQGKLDEPVELAFNIERPAQTLYEDTYSITAGDDPHDKDYLAMGWHMMEPDAALDGYGLKILEEILFGNNQSPLKKALLDANIGGDIDGGTAEFGYPMAFYIIAKYSDAKKMDEFNTVVKETLEKLVEEGIPTELIDAALNKIIFDTKEAAISEDNPRGVLYAITSLGTWLYGEDPFVNLEFSTYLDQLSEMAHDGYFEKLIEEKFLKNNQKVNLVLEAEPGKNDAIEAAVFEKLQAHKTDLSDEAIAEIIADTQKLIERQDTPDKPEDLAKIPTLTRDDLTTDAPDYPIASLPFFENTTFYHAEQFTSGIDYVRLYFDISDIPEEDFTTLGYLSNLLTHLKTKNYDASKLQTALDTHTGGISAKISIFEDLEGTIKPYFVLAGRGLEDALDELLHLMKEIVYHTEFDEQAEISKLNQRLISNFEGMINNRANILATNRALSQIKPAAKLSERLSGIEKYNFLKDNREVLTSEAPFTLSDTLKELLTTIISVERMNVLYIGEAERGDIVKNKLKDIFSDLPRSPLSEAVTYSTGAQQNEAFVTAQDVNYVALGADASESLDYSGHSNVLSTIIRYEYLWNEIRVKGGAYGSMYAHNRNGNLALGSYRDPNISETLTVYNKLPNFVKQVELSDEELTKYIIGTMSPLEQPQSAESKGLIAFNRLQTGRTAADLAQLKEEILNTKTDDLHVLAGNMAAALDNHTVVVIGNKSQIDNESELFDEVHKLY